MMMNLIFLINENNFIFVRNILFMQIGYNLSNYCTLPNISPNTKSNYILIISFSTIQLLFFFFLFFTSPAFSHKLLSLVTSHYSFLVQTLLIKSLQSGVIKLKVSNYFFILCDISKILFQNLDCFLFHFKFNQVISNK